MKLTKGLRVGVKTWDYDKSGKPIEGPAKFFGQVTRPADDGESAYVQMDGQADETFFHSSELAPEKTK